METEVAEIKRIENGKFRSRASLTIGLLRIRVPQGRAEQAEDG